jgi:hypothetical protein
LPQLQPRNNGICRSIKARPKGAKFRKHVTLIKARVNVSKIFLNKTERRPQMKVSQSVTNFLNYQKMNSKKNTVKNYRLFLNKFGDLFRTRHIETITSDEILTFLTDAGEGQKQSNKRFKYTLLKTYFNFIKNTVDPNLSNPCDSPVLKKTFRLAKAHQ